MRLRAMCLLIAFLAASILGEGCAFLAASILGKGCTLLDHVGLIHAS